MASISSFESEKPPLSEGGKILSLLIVGSFFEWFRSDKDRDHFFTMRIQLPARCFVGSRSPMIRGGYLTSAR
jgi:hypothetical protein